MNSIYKSELEEHITVMQSALSLEPLVDRAVDVCLKVLRAGNKIMLVGNGGSAADAQHIAAEFVVRFRRERKGLAALALTTDMSALTAAANDYDFERVFARQVQALGQAGDLLIAISTSGTSPNVVMAAKQAKESGIQLLTITGSKKTPMSELADIHLPMPSENTARIQECYLFIGHILCERVEARF